MTEQSPRQKTSEAYAAYRKEMQTNAVERAMFEEEGRPKLKRRWKKFVKVGVGGSVGFAAIALCSTVDFFVDAYALSSMTYAIPAMIGVGTAFMGFGACDEMENKERVTERGIKDKIDQASSKLLKAVTEEIKSYGMIVLQTDVENQFITTNQGIVTLATDKHDPSTLNLLLNNEVLMPTYHGESRPMVTLQGVETNAPTIVRV